MYHRVGRVATLADAGLSHRLVPVVVLLATRWLPYGTFPLRDSVSWFPLVLDFAELRLQFRKLQDMEINAVFEVVSDIPCVPSLLASI